MNLPNPQPSTQPTMQKEQAARAAMAELRDGMVVGLGTGSTAEFFLQALARAIATGKLKDIRGVPTSAQSDRRAKELGIPLASFAEIEKIDVTIDGADEIDPQLNLIKGLGGALLREKIVAQNSDRLIIIADQSKVVPQLGTKSALPVEIVSFGHESQIAFLRKLGATPTLRVDSSGKPFITDGGNFIFDCRFRQIDRPDELQAALRDRAGIVGTGLFLNLATVAYIAGADAVERRTRGGL